jgi:transketolase
MRNAFINELVLLARTNSSITLVVGDLGYSVIEPFADEFPDRFFNAGVAEQNMTGLSAGLASEGQHVFTYSIANFPSFRCAEQIRNDIDYHNLPVTVVAVGGGLSYGALGYSHHAVQDYALFRSFPNTMIAAPGDPNEVRSCLRYLVNNPSPSYLRLGKAGEPTYHKNIPNIEPGKWLKYKDGDDKSSAILTTGATMTLAHEWLNEEKYKNYELFSMPLWSMSTKQNQIEHIKSKSNIVTIEDHLQDGGFGSWLLEANSFNNVGNVSIETKALNHNVCGTVGSQATLNKMGGIAK